MNAKLYLYFRFDIYLEPMSENHFLAFADKLVTHSSSQAATTMDPSSRRLLVSKMNFSNSSEDLYVSKILAYSILPFWGLTRTICKPLVWLELEDWHFTISLSMQIFEVLPA